MVYTVTLNPCIDYVMSVDSLQFDDINRSNNEQIYYGGKGINVSVILSRLGIDNTALGFLAGFTGKEVEKMLLEEKISCDFCYLESGFTRINVKIRSQSEFDINANGPSISSDDINNLMKKLDSVKQGDYLVIAGSIPKGVPNDIYSKILKSLKDRGINFVVDTTGELLLNSLEYKPFLIKPNHKELGELFNKTAETEEEITSLAKELIYRGARNVLVSRGNKGAMLFDENGKMHKIGIVEGKLINSVGCGDSMVGGFLAGYIEKGDFEYALKLASACSNATAFSNSLATKQEIDYIFQNKL